MKISAIHLKNFKSYKGITKIENLDNHLSDNQNIILIGGLNGAGKTTFLEALFLCFYGSGAVGLYPVKGATNEVYNSFIYALLNNEVKNSGLLEMDMSIEIFLKDIEITGNFPRNVSFKRKWTFLYPQDIQKCTIKENFEILENNILLSEFKDKDECEDRVKAILPYNVAQLFFFDGEKIQDFAGDPENEFSNALKNVLGINLYTTLADDLKQVRSRILSEYNKNKQAEADRQGVRKNKATKSD